MLRRSSLPRRRLQKRRIPPENFRQSSGSGYFAKGLADRKTRCEDLFVSRPKPGSVVSGKTCAQVLKTVSSCRYFLQFLQMTIIETRLRQTPCDAIAFGPSQEAHSGLLGLETSEFLTIHRIFVLSSIMSSSALSC